MNLTPGEQHRFAVALSCYVAPRRNARGATLLASLESELSDSASLRYLRPARLRLAAVRRLANPCLFAKKKKTEHPKGYSVFLAEKKGFEPSRRLPDLHP